MGAAYARNRNTDFGPGRHQNVSTLSPYLRRRLITERQVVATALSEHGLEGAQRFIEEVFWRGYFKGWLERRPAVWDSYRSGMLSDQSAIAKDGALRARLADAENGATGLDCFDAWSRELVETGYLHNHARMWFASIWIFTLRLPWRLGADFFYRHLLDGDPASNTLGWRWVAGLHTRGRPYVARPHNIAQFTAGRFHPSQADLRLDVEPLDEIEEPAGLPDVVPVRVPRAPEPGRPSVLLITEEDCRPDDFPVEAFDIRAIATLRASHLRSPNRVSPLIDRFEEEALGDAAHHIPAALSPDALVADDPDRLARWAAEAGATQLITAFVPRGPLRDWLDVADAVLLRRGVTLTELQRDWDARMWAYTTAGFFKVKKQIPRLLASAGF